ncbi:hypothetical protein HPB48_003680 [Haemaphysalis longicornis]|uniref:Tick transposon n=1 Tax=Haemaphysalis longicornis TaxID=44386 RepID=A0A9J6FGN9_HAELO|nr:hypothetical protein HPB48_003680 [Haemaphysalis longicornis]
MPLRTPDVRSLPTTVQAAIHVTPLPCNMNPDLHPERRQARVRQLTKTLRQQSNVWYIDATPYAQRPSCCAVACNYLETSFTACTVPMPNIAAAEQCAIALAIVRITASGTPGTIVTDSQDAYRTISNGLGSPHTLAVLRTIPDMHPLPQINLIWAPAHAGLEGNEATHDWACECTNQEPVDRPVSPDLHCHPLLTYSDILHYYRETRQQYPNPSCQFTRQQTTTLRLIQTNTYLHPKLFSRIYPETYTDQCPRCKIDKATLPHIFWACPKAPPTFIKSRHDWETALRSNDPEIQLRLVRLALDAPAPVARPHEGTGVSGRAGPGGLGRSHTGR